MKKYIITESQLSILLEQKGLPDLFTRMSEEYPDSVYMLSYLKNFIEKSGCKKISVENLAFKASGLSTTDGITLNTSVFNKSFSDFLYTLFHEVAHQYQYKKYGIDVMYACYTGDLTLEQGGKWMMNVERVADEFSIRKIREVKRIFGDTIKIKEKKDKAYDNTPASKFEGLISMFIERIKVKGYQDKNEIAQILYNVIKNG